MPAIYALFGLLAAVFAGSGGSSASAAPVAASNEAPSANQTPSMDDSSGEGGSVEGGSVESMDDAAEDDMPHGMDHDDHMDMGGDKNDPVSAYLDITAFGTHHGTSSHTMGHSLEGGRTPITTEALEAYNGLRDFLGLDPAGLEDIGRWAFDKELTNNDQPYGEDLSGVGLFYGMQGAKVGWIRDDAFDPQLLADIQRTARLGEQDDVMQMVEDYGLDGFADFLNSEGLVETFVNTMKMEPHYGGWMHGRTHGWRPFDDETGEQVAIAHDLNHLTVLSHDQTQPFMNDTFDWPQWPALEMPEADVANYFQSMVTLGDPEGEGITVEMEVSAATPQVVYMGEDLMVSLSLGLVPDDAPSVDADDTEEMLELL